MTPEAPAMMNGLGLHLRAFEARAAPLHAARVFAPEDLYAVDAVAERFGERDPEVLLALALAARAPRAGHAGVDLMRVRDHLDLAPSHADAAAAAAFEAAWPSDSAAWLTRTLASPMVAAADAPEARTRPFVAQPMDGFTLLSTRRMFVEQQRVALRVRNLARDLAPPPGFEDTLARLLGDERDSESGKAIRLAATRRLALVTGGPGTGKTFSIKRLLALLLSHETRPLRIELAAPTGKAAVRMAEAMGEGLDDLAVPDEVRARLRGLVPQTLHKLVGIRPDGTSRHHAGHTLPADLIVVDEVSMVDLTLMRQLLDAIGGSTRLVLLGDRDQLASVEAGSVLSDLVRAAELNADLGRSVVRFTQSRRFASAPDIATVARDLQAGDAESRAHAVSIMRGRAHAAAETLPDRITWLGAPATSASGLGVPTEAQLEALAAPYFGTGANRGYAAMLAEALAAYGSKHPHLADPALRTALLAALEHYRVLAVHREGPLGVSGLERELARRVSRHLAATLGKGPAARLPSRGDHWLGRPILVTQNAYDVGLMNGDVGLILPDVDGRLEAVFLATTGGKSGLHAVSLSRLPPHEGALAMTVHKSQGSQFDRVALVLAGRPSPIQRRELVYTAITRAKSRLDWLGSETELTTALAQTVVRTSGLTELILADTAVPTDC
jgi:exodeoxyribonuclease V alpha subunit